MHNVIIICTFSVGFMQSPANQYKEHCGSHSHMIVLWIYLGAPTYGEVITLLNQAKLEAVQNHSYAGDILVQKFQQKFPGVSIPTRSYRLLQAAERIAAPMQNKKKILDGDEACIYMQKIWKIKATGEPLGYMFLQSNLVSEYTWGPSELLLTIVLANHID